MTDNIQSNPIEPKGFEPPTSEIQEKTALTKAVSPTVRRPSQVKVLIEKFESKSQEVVKEAMSQKPKASLKTVTGSPIGNLKLEDKQSADKTDRISKDVIPTDEDRNFRELKEAEAELDKQLRELVLEEEYADVDIPIEQEEFSTAFADLDKQISDLEVDADFVQLLEDTSFPHTTLATPEEIIDKKIEHFTHFEEGMTALNKQIQETSKKETIETPKKKEMSENDVKAFVEYKNLLDGLKPKMKLTMKKDGQIELQKRNMVRIGPFFKSGRSKETRAALNEILTKINTAIEEGHTSFKLPNGQEIKLKDLASNYLKTEYAKNIIKNSPEEGKQLGQLYINMILKADPHSLRSQDIKKEYETITKKYEPEKFEDFFTQLPLEVERSYVRRDELIKIKNLESHEVPTYLSISESDLKLDQKGKVKMSPILSEVFDTEVSFYENLNKLPALYGELRKANLITKEEYLNYLSLTEDVMIESETLVENLKKLVNSPTAEKLQETIKLFSPKNITSYYESFLPFNKEYNTIRTKLSNLNSDPQAKKIFNDFALSNNQIDPESVIIMPVQRLPRHVMLIDSMIGNLKMDQNPQIREELQTNLSYLRSYASVINNSTPDINPKRR